MTERGNRFRAGNWDLEFVVDGAGDVRNAYEIRDGE